MVRHFHRQEGGKPGHQSSRNAACTFASQKPGPGLLLVFSVMAALLLCLSVPAGKAAAHMLSPADQISDLQQQMFTLINNDRAAQGLPPYNWDATLAAGAGTHSDLMATSCGLQHQCPGESDPGTRISTEGVSSTSWGENIGYWGGDGDYSNDLAQIEQSMMNEGPGGGHYDNLMSPSFQKVGIGVSIDANGYVWVTEDFVQP